MASEEEGGSLFEGMVLFAPSDLFPPSEIPPPHAAAPLPPEPTPPPSSPIPPVSQPLDEDLFSNLTLLSAPPSVSSSSDDPPPVIPSPSRQISRKKKRAVRVGYARDDEAPAPTSTPTPRPLNSSHSGDHRDDVISSAVPPEDKVEDQDAVSDIHPVEGQVSATEDAPPKEKDEYASVEEKLDLIKAQVSKKLDRLREMAASMSVQRKQLGRRRREAAEGVNSVFQRYKELEKELEEACEAEDFERAERLSESLAAAEMEKDALLTALKDAEADCDAVDVKMQELLDLQIEAEEEGLTLLEQFAKDAAYTSELIFKKAEEISVERTKEWQSSMEILEGKMLEAEIESHVINEAHHRLESSIEHLVEDDRQEKEMLQRKQETLAKELAELLAMVRMKEAEIADNNSKIQEVERRISNVVTEFCGTQSNIDNQFDDLQSSILKLESERGSLSIKKMEIDESVSKAEEKCSKLNKLASDSADEAKKFKNLVDLKKSFASSILKSREEKIRLAKTEEKILEHIQTLRQQNSSARNSLQELSATRAGVQQDLTSLKQRISFIDKRGPELEAEKKVAAAARNFKEAGRIAAEAKALNLERESLLDKRDKAITHLEMLEAEIKDTIDKMQESEELIICKEKEAAIAACQRLRLVAAAAMAERSAALELGDIEEGNILLQEAETADSKASELQKAHDLETEEHGKPFDPFISIALITNLSGQRLSEMISSFNLLLLEGPNYS
ncbi:hypothetical protein J5N97_005521 [Dioscorea zingiberensis]|uniref:UVR domain-containing protein n=1 Tax=Dioscorea zingiberensis TaxID=325984 RepID=A0A9D5HRZ1_9LILI|nr:hypothetical protein J5N97_005521 [Dioscorea zingiberensis]